MIIGLGLLASVSYCVNFHQINMTLTLTSSYFGAVINPDNDTEAEDEVEGEITDWKTDIEHIDTINNEVDDEASSIDLAQSLQPKAEATYDDDKKFISYKIIQGLKHNGTYDPIHWCSEGDRVFHDTFKQSGVLDFNTRIKTNLRIAYIGESVGTQFAQALQESTGMLNIHTIRYAWGDMHKNSHNALVSGGGAVAGLRVTCLMLNRSRNQPRRMAPSSGGGWLEYYIREMKRLMNHWRPLETTVGGWSIGTSPCENNTNSNSPNSNPSNGTNSAYSCKETDFDVVVHQFAVSIDIDDRSKHTYLYHLFLYT